MDNATTTPIVGYQSWRSLLFAHWRIDPAKMQALLPRGLTVDTFDGSAWLAVVPFSMERVRPWWSPPVPGISWFLETNVRTYVKHESGQTGVWFFSLDANHRLAVEVARRFWHLNYVFSAMQMSTQNGELAFRGQRPNEEYGSYDIKAEVDPDSQLKVAEQGTLEYFLLERYHLFAQRPNGSFFCGQVHHEPYEFQSLLSANISQTLTAAAGLPISSETKPDHLAFSPGVDVKVSPLSEV